MSHQPSRSNEIEDFERTFYDSWRDFWSEESQYTEQTYLTADTVGIIKDYCKGLLTRIVQAKDAETKRAVEEERKRIEAVFIKEVPPHAMDLEDSVWLKRLLNKAFNHK